MYVEPEYLNRSPRDLAGSSSPVGLRQGLWACFSYELQDEAGGAPGPLNTMGQPGLR